MDNIKANQPLLLVPKRKGVNKFLRAGSKRQTKVRAFQITYDKAHQGTPIRDTIIQDKCKVDENRSSGRSSRVANKSRRVSSSTDLPSRKTSVKQTESQSLSRTGDIPEPSQHHSTQDDYSEQQGKVSPLRHSKKGLSNQSGQFPSTSSSRSQGETRNRKEIPVSGDDEGASVPPDISDCENISPNSQTRTVSKRRSPRKSIGQMSDFLQKRKTNKSSDVVVVSGRESSSVKGTPPRKMGDVSEESRLNSQGLNDEGSEKAQELSEMLAKIKQVETTLSSPLLRSARRKNHHSSRTKNASILKSSDRTKKSEKNEKDISCVDGNKDRADSESIQTENEMDEGDVDGVITRSSRSSSTKENSLSVVPSDKNAAVIINSEIEEEADEASRMRLKRLEKQLGGMTPLGLRETVEVSNTGKINLSQHEKKDKTVLSAPVDKKMNSSDSPDNAVKSVKSKKHGSVSRTNSAKNKTGTSNLEEAVGTPSKVENNVSSQSKRKAKNRKEMQKAFNQSSSLHEPKKCEDEGVNVSRRGRSTARGERSDSEDQNRTIESEVLPEQAKKLEKLQKQLGGMSPMDRTLALLSESRAKLSTTMPSLLDLSASKSREANSKASTKLTRVTKQQMKNESKSTNSIKPESVKRRKESSSNQDSSKSVKVKIKLKVNKKKKMTKGKAKLLIDSDPTENDEVMQTSESEMEDGDPTEELTLRRKRKISDLSDLDVVLHHLKEEGEASRNDLKKKRLRTVHDDIISGVTSDMLELINLNTRMNSVTSLERKAQTKLTKKRKELLEMQQEHRKLCSHITNLKKQKQTSVADPDNNEEVSQFLKCLEHLYNEAGRVASDGE